MKKEYSSKILIEFDMLFDTDAGVIRTVDEKYCDESIFFKEITELDDNLLAGLLKERTMINPLQIAFRDESDTKLMDSLYNQLMEKDYEDIVDNAIPTAIYDTFLTFLQSDGAIEPTILCRNYYQRKVAMDILAGEDSNKFRIVLNQNDTINVKGFTDIYIRNIESILQYENLDGMNVFIADLEINKEPIPENANPEIKRYRVPKKEYAIMIIDITKMHFIEMYAYDNSYFFDEDYEEEEEDNQYDVMPGLRNDEFIKKFVGEDFIEEVYAQEGLDQYDKNNDPYNSGYFVDLNEDDEIDADSLDEFPEFFESEKDPDEPEEGDEIIVDDSEEFYDHYTQHIYHKPKPEEDNSDEMYDDEEDEDLEEFERDPLPYLTDIINMEMKLDKSQKVFEKMVEESLKNEMEEEEDE